MAAVELVPGPRIGFAEPWTLDEVIYAWPNALAGLKSTTRAVIQDAQPIDLDDGVIVFGAPAARVVEVGAVFDERQDAIEQALERSLIRENAFTAAEARLVASGEIVDHDALSTLTLRERVDRSRLIHGTEKPAWLKAHEAKAAPAFDPALIPDVGRTFKRSAFDTAVDDAYDRDDIIDIYAKFIGKAPLPVAGGKREGIKCRCPMLGHEDKRPSAWINTDKQEWFCGACNVGGDKWKLIGIGKNLDTRTQFPELRKAYAVDRGIEVPTYAAPTGTTDDAASAATRSIKVVSDAPVDQALAKLVRGGAILEAPEKVPGVWGRDDDVLWAKGETVLLVGGDGVGKTTLGQQLGLARIGLFDRRGLTNELLGYEVEIDDRRLLYIAADRPAQAMRSLRRMVRPEEKAFLDERVVIHKGPFPTVLNREPEMLVQLAAAIGAGTIIVDSLKDVASDIAKDEGGSGIARAFQLVVAEGIELVVMHHNRKQSNGGVAPNKLDDLYGSRLIYGATGSVLMLWGEAGDSDVKLTHLKQPATLVGPLKLHHDHTRGCTSLTDEVDPLKMAAAAGAEGLTVKAYACKRFDTEKPTNPEIERCRRALTNLTNAGKLAKLPEARPDKWVLAS